MRNSSVELLRIVAMFSIVIGHVFYHGFHGQLMESEYLRPFTCCGVDVFILISGYFGIRFKLKSVVNLLLMVVFYVAFSGVIEYFFFGHEFSLSRLSGILLPFSGNHYYWFITCYIALYLMSPILNAGIQWLHDNHYLKTACWLLLYVNCVSGWLIGNAMINENGFNVMHFLFLYVVGRTVSICDFINKFRQRHLLCMYSGLFLVCAALGGGKMTYYNSPLIIGLSLMLLMIFLKLKFHSAMINKIASTMFAVYLLQDGLAGQSAYQLLYNAFINQQVYVVVVYVLALFLGAYLMETVRVPLMRPVVQVIARRMEKRNLKKWNKKRE